MTDDPVVCVCAGVHEEELTSLIRAGVRTIDGIRMRCRANTGCGGCREDIEELIDDLAGSGPESAPEPHAACRSIAHRSVGPPAGRVTHLEEHRAHR
jgi:NAD(P)H-nitrite reductase large subunit